EAVGVIVGAAWWLGSFGRRRTLGDPQRGGDARPQLGGRLLGALRHDHPPQLELERESLGARRTVVEVASDRPALPDGQLTVEILVDAYVSVLAIHGVSAPRRRLDPRPQVVAFRVVPQLLLQCPPPPVDPAHDRADRDIEDVRDLLVR